VSERLPRVADKLTGGPPRAGRCPSRGTAPVEAPKKTAPLDRRRLPPALPGAAARFAPDQILVTVELNVPSVPVLTRRLSPPETTVPLALAVTPVVFLVMVLSDE